MIRYVWAPSTGIKIVDGEYTAGGVMGAKPIKGTLEDVFATEHRRTRPAKLLTMSPEAWERLDLIASRAGLSRSAMVETLVRGAEVPRAKTAGKAGV
jgi:hypothetical protein